MKAEEIKNIKVGDTVKFTAWDRDGRFTLTRKVVEVRKFSNGTGIGVNARWCRPFWVKPTEIKEIITQ